MRIAVLIPCYNEEITIGKVVTDFKRELPEADIYVYDNNSSDYTYKIAAEAGAIVTKEYRQGKGNVVRSMFRNIDADYYVMVDGDDTYPAEFVHKLLRPIIDKEADMVIGDRLSNGSYKCENKRAFHNAGNNLVRYMINKLFKSNICDIMTGYRAFNREFVKSMPILSAGFEIETEMSIHALDKKFLIKELPIEYRDRPVGSFSKLNTFNDGIKVLKTIFHLFKDYKPLIFFLTFSFILFIMGLLTGLPVIIEFVKTRYISKVPSAILAVGFIVLSMLSLVGGLILDTVVNQNRRIYELYLNMLSDRAK
ncbi:glycosyltransferase family 2 protein [Clostridium oryzae]|uniref:Undecaprenyl-phosphate mannosyltransferase n=1 Tax=Clostridium oryzae TaxID=1450648 RepID=A0A1V4IR67_9CLOT|nr:glycosyltransferase family 2 protein [Clostridium oryzae]OPJ62426.1 undecaprenyl-phosphate mannosyltransferase [Clostridium oryzae]